MDIKKPGPVKAHSFLKLNPCCKKISDYIKKQSYKNNNNTKFARVDTSM